MKKYHNLPDNVVRFLEKQGILLNVEESHHYSGDTESVDRVSLEFPDGNTVTIGVYFEEAFDAWLELELKE